MGLIWPWATAEKRRAIAELRSQAESRFVERKEGRYVLTGLFGGEGFGFFLGVEVAEMRMAGAARSAALAAIGKGKSTQIGTVFGTNRGHGSLQKS